MGRRKFAKNAQEVHHFRLVSRPQNDAFADNPDAPGLVLEPFVKAGDVKRTGLSEAELAQVPEEWLAKHPEAFADLDAPPRDPNENYAAPSGDDEDPEAALEGDCYFPPDGYNYNQHLKKVTGTGGKKGGGGGVGVVLEATVKVPEAEIKKQAAETQEEAELLRCLEIADEYEELEEETLEELLPGGCLDPTLVLWGPKAVEDADLPDLAEFKAMHAARRAAMAAAGDEEDEDEDEGGEGRQRAAPAEAGVSAAAFEEFFAAEYGDEDDMGACDDEEIEGEVELDEAVLDEYLEDKKAENEKLHSLYEPVKGKLDDVPRVIEETKALIEKYYSHIEDGDDTSSGEESEDESRTWDCESVLSTLSNVSNRPGKIGKLKIIKKPAPAMKSLKEEDERSGDEEQSEEEDVVELPDVNTERKKDETPEEKKARKAGVKAMRKICRQMKKESKQTYKDEATKLKDKQGQTGDIRQKSRCFRL